MIERSHLSIIREVHRTGTVTGAAERLCLTQPALSHAIKKLEQRFGIKLWLKDGRKLRFTQAGRVLLSLADRLLPQFEQTEELLRRYAQGQGGILKIGMECHPCYQWLLRIVSPFLQQWPNVDLDVKQAFQFGGFAALFHSDIDLLVTPDPIFKSGIQFHPVFDYELVIVVGDGHALASQDWIDPDRLSSEILLTYPVSTDRLDVYTQFMLPAGCRPRQRKLIETTEIMLEMVAAGRGVTALPDWLVREYGSKLALQAIRLGRTGIHKQIFLGIREEDAEIGYIQGFLNLASESR